MASRHQTFKQGQVLNAADLNDTCNPTTADHLAYATHATEFNDGQKTGGSYARNVQFPAGRFTKPPVVQVSLANAAAGANNVLVAISNISATGCRVHFLPITGGLNATCSATVIAIQMGA